MRDRRSLREPADAEGTGSPGSSGGGIDDEITGHDDLAHGPLRASSSADQAGPLDEPALDECPDRSAPVPHGRTAVRTWPLLILALPASIAVWSGWVGIGQMTGFGEIRPFPGIWNSFYLDTAVTLPAGVEAYAAFALRAWLTSNPAISDRTRRCARWSAISAMVLGMTASHRSFTRPHNQPDLYHHLDQHARLSASFISRPLIRGLRQRRVEACQVAGSLPVPGVPVRNASSRMRLSAQAGQRL